VPGDQLDVRTVVVVHTVARTGKPPYMNTTGLRRFGLSELYVPEVSDDEIEDVTALMNAAAQHLVAGGDVDDSGQIAIDFHKLGWHVNIRGKGTGKATWKTRWGRDPASGDEVLELDPATGTGLDEQKQMVEACFGSHPAAKGSAK
jgi:hypothetical protein